MPEVLLRLLGPMELRVGEQLVPLGPARQRTVLAALAVDAGRPVPLDTLIDRVWDDDPPASARTVVYTYITRLRRVLRATDGRVALRRQGGGYVLDAEPDTVDVARFTRMTKSVEAFALWRGPALADLSGGWVLRTRQRLAQVHLDALLAWGRAELAEGRPRPVIETVREPAAQNPLVEPLAALLIDALYRDGRAAEALDRYAGLRRHLVAELGAEPGPELRELHRDMLRGADRRPADAGPADTLPADMGTFTGRSREVDRILAADAGEVLVIHAIAGMPGVGKTALAVHVAHRLRDRFPDGQVFADLHGHTAGREPADPGDVLATLLAGDGVEPARIPAGLDARAARWRARLADRRMLIVLDNAVDSAQVAPLLPGSAGCLVLVTSRRFLGDLPGDAEPISLDVLAPDEAERMFRRLAPHASGDVAALVAACGFLPLAISLVARVRRRHRRWTVGDLLRETRDRLLDVTAEHASVAAAFGLSYQQLPAARQEFFRLLAAHPGTEFEPDAVAALTGVPPDEAAAGLDALHADSLLIEVGYRRYTMHDLIRSYATSLAAPDPAAVDRLLDFYQQLTDLSRLRVERSNVLACLAAATEPRRIVALTAGLTELLRRDGPWTEAIAAHARAAELADGLDRAGALVDLATVRRLSGDYSGAEADLRRALSTYRRLEHWLGEATALIGLAKALSRAGDYVASAAVAQDALAVFGALGDRPGQVGALVELAIARGMTSDFRGAQELLRQALDLYRELGDRLGAAYALRILGIAHGRVGDFAGGRELLTEALVAYQALGSRSGEALTLNDLGRAAAGLGDFPAAVAVLRTALDRHRASEHRVGQSAALLYLGGALRRSGDLAGAAEALGEALTLDREIGNRSGLAMVLNELGAVRLLSGDVDRAVAAHREALELAELVPSPYDKAQSLAGFGRCALAGGRVREGAAQLRDALEILRRIDAAEAGEVAVELHSSFSPK